MFVSFIRLRPPHRLESYEDRHLIFNFYIITCRLLCLVFSLKPDRYFVLNIKLVKSMKYQPRQKIITSLLSILYLLPSSLSAALRGRSVSKHRPRAPAAVCAHHLAAIKHKTPSLRLHASTHQHHPPTGRF